MWNGCIRMLCSAWNTSMKLKLKRFESNLKLENKAGWSSQTKSWYENAMALSLWSV
jgi:hypothetical protein